MTRLAPALTLLVMLGPVGAGLAGTLLPAFGYLPALGGERLSLDPWRDLLAAPGLMASLGLTLATGLVATLVSLALALGCLAAAHGTRLHAWAERAVAPLVAVPHVAAALGLAFLVAPSGWILRLLAGLTGGFPEPPDYLLPQDPWGAALVLGLTVKETPYLLLMALAAEAQAGPAPLVAIARSLGYGPAEAWIKCVLPAIYRRIRLPVYAVLAYALSVVDMALILGPSAPAPFAVELFRWFRDPDLALRFQAAAGALLLLLLVAAAIGAWAGGARLVGRLGRRLLAEGRRGGRLPAWRGAALAAAALVLALAALGLLGMALWSVAATWRYPAVLPGEFGLAVWARQAAGLAWPLGVTVAAALGAAAAALLLALGCLENEARRGLAAGEGALWLLYLPLLVPQLAFLFGVQVLLAATRLDGGFLALAWSHLVFVLPYLFLALADPYRAFDTRYARAARALGAGPLRVFLRVKLPMLLRPVLVALAMGFAVSIALYLPTLFAGGGRFTTLTTEAVALAGGGDRRVIGVYAVLQTVLPLLLLALAVAVPARRTPEAPR